MNIQSLTYSVIVASALILTGCASAGSVVSSNSDTSSAIKVHDPSLSLADYIRRSGGVSVHNIDGQTRIRIRGNLSFNSESDPLFVIDGIRSGNNYDRVQGMIPVESIKSIEVLKGGDASSMYGLAASSGAIVIHTIR